VTPLIHPVTSWRTPAPPWPLVLKDLLILRVGAGCGEDCLEDQTVVGLGARW